jgi:protein DGCR14
MTSSSSSSSSVLERIADPLAYQVFPSRKRARAAEDGAGGPIGTGMPPPPPRQPRLALRASPPTREVLSTAAYEAALEHIVEHTFFPDLPRMRQQLSWLEALDSGDAARIDAARQEISGSVRRSRGVVSATPLGSAAQAPKRAAGGSSRMTVLSSWTTAPPGSQRSVAQQQQQGEEGASTAPPSLGLADFQARFTSQDGEVFRENMAARIANMERRLWWLHCDPRRTSRSQLLALTDSGTAPPLVLGDASNEHGVPQPASWPWRPRNALFFPPSLAASENISGLGGGAASMEHTRRHALLRDSGSSGGGGPRGSLSSRYAGLDLLCASAPAAPSKHARAPPPPPPRIEATRFGAAGLAAAEAAGQRALRRDAAAAAAAAAAAQAQGGGGAPDWNGLPLKAPLGLHHQEHPHHWQQATPGRSASAAASSFFDAAHPLLPTPIIYPGGGGGELELEPIITWGTLAGVPSVLYQAEQQQQQQQEEEEEEALPLTAAGLAAAFGLPTRQQQEQEGWGEEGAAPYALPQRGGKEVLHEHILARLQEKREGGAAAGAGSGGGGGGGGGGGREGRAGSARVPVTGAFLHAMENVSRGGVLGAYGRAGYTPVFFAGRGVGGGGGGGSSMAPSAAGAAGVAGVAAGASVGGGSRAGSLASGMTGSTRATSALRAHRALSALAPAARLLLQGQAQAQVQALVQAQAQGSELGGVFAAGAVQKRSRSGGGSKG